MSLSHCMASKPHPLSKNWRTHITGNIYIYTTPTIETAETEENMDISRHKVRLESREKKQHGYVLDILCHAFHQISHAHPGKTSLRNKGQHVPGRGPDIGDFQRQKGTSWMGWNKTGKLKVMVKNRSKPYNWMCYETKCCNKSGILKN